MESNVENRTYPYLGGKTEDNKNAVVMFCEPNKGICLQNSGMENIPFGVYMEYNENEFTFVDPSINVRLNN